MRRGTLLTQVLTVNLLLIAAAVIAASVASNPENSLRDSATVGLVLGFALAATVAVNIWLLTRRFEPLERLVTEMENADLSKPPTAPAVAAGPIVTSARPAAKAVARAAAGGIRMGAIHRTVSPVYEVGHRSWDRHRTACCRVSLLPRGSGTWNGTGGGAHRRSPRACGSARARTRTGAEPARR